MKKILSLGMVAILVLMTLALPFFAIAEVFCTWVSSKFRKYYEEYRFHRSDNTLLLTCMKVFAAKVEGYYNRIRNTFGIKPVLIELENGTQDGERRQAYYFLMPKKIYSNRFSTDCFSEFFAVKGLRSEVGLQDISTYADVRASFQELGEQNSYFVSELLEGFRRVTQDGEEEAPKKRKRKLTEKQQEKEKRKAALAAALLAMQQKRDEGEDESED